MWIGYSMGARIAAFLALAHPERVQSLVFGGLGINMVRGMAGAGPSRMRSKRRASTTSRTRRAAFRVFAEQTKSDLKALVACIRSARSPITAEAVGVSIGSRAGGGRRQRRSGGVGGGSPAALIPGAEAFVIAGREHMKAVGDHASSGGVGFPRASSVLI